MKFIIKSFLIQYIWFHILILPRITICVIIQIQKNGMMVYDDSAFNDGFTLTDSYSVYPNAFNSYSNDGRYTKHIYIGSERIASQLSTSFPAQGNVAGYNVGIRVDYATKRDLMNAQIDSAYTAFGLWWNRSNPTHLETVKTVHRRPKMTEIGLKKAEYIRSTVAKTS